MGDGFKSYDRVCVRRDKQLSKHGLEFGELVVRISRGEDIPDAVRNHVMSYLEMMRVPLPKIVNSSTMYDFARLYDGFIGIVGIIEAKNRRDDLRDRRRSVCLKLCVIVLVVFGLVAGAIFGLIKGVDAPHVVSLSCVFAVGVVFILRFVIPFVYGVGFLAVMIVRLLFMAVSAVFVFLSTCMVSLFVRGVRAARRVCRRIEEVTRP